MTLYHQIANQLGRQIQQGLYPAHARLPGVRRLSVQFGVSIATIVQAQQVLETQGVIEARPRSGYYIKPQPLSSVNLPKPSKPDLKPMPVTGQELVLQLAQNTQYHNVVQLGAAVPSVDFMPMRAFQRSLAKTVRQYGHLAAKYAFPPGIESLQTQIAKRMYYSGVVIPPEPILITNGCQEALFIALRTIAKAGDIIALESPTFYGLLQVIDALGMKALEIPSDPRTGISLAALELALEQWPIAACVLTVNFSNPLGSVMPYAQRQHLLQLAQRYQLCLIEDDIYGDLGFNGERPRSLLSFEDNPLQGQTLYCSSFSKTVAQGTRIGWLIVPERYQQRATYLKYVSNLAAPTLPQLALADFLEHGGYERYLRQVRGRYAQQVQIYTQAILRYFPSNTRVSQPQGGFVLWVELNKQINTLELVQQALTQGISVAPGQIFSASQKYQHCLRISCAQCFTSTVEQALQTLGQMCQQCLVS